MPASPRHDQLSLKDDRRGRSNTKDSSSPDTVPSPSSWIMTRGRSRVRRISDMSDPFSEETLRKRGYHSFRSFDQTFRVEKRWKLNREMGSGAYGVVISAADEISGETVAIKMVTRVFEKVSLAKRALRELTLLRHFNNHENITGLIDVDAISPGFNEIYLFMEPMEADLHQIIKSGQSLTNEHVQYFIYQILRGMKYIHSASVVHRDLKPGNLLVNSDCELKICDFGLSRGFDARSEDGASHMTEYVATRWYRAPEIMLAFKRYNTAIDVWSIGCILAELLLGRPLFKGKDYVDQLNKILDFVGTPSEGVLKRIGSEKAQAYVRTLPIRKKTSLQKLIPNVDPQALDLLDKMLTFDPAARITVPDALAHPWLSSYHDVNDEPECTRPFERWREIEELVTLDDFRTALWNEIEDYRREVRAIALELDDEDPAPLRSPSILESHSPAHMRSLSSSGYGASSAESPAHRYSQLPPKSSRAPSFSSTPAQPPPDGVPPNAVEFPSRSRTEASPEPVAKGEPVGRRARDPLVSYARRASMFSTSTSPEFHPTRTPSWVDGGANTDADTFIFPSINRGDGYVLPARSRTASIAVPDMSRRLLRTLSTVSIHEPVDLSALADAMGVDPGVADMARYIRERERGADAPPSAMPGVLGGTDEGSGEKTQEEGGE